MKKQLKLLIGFPVGVMVLMLTYVLIGAVDGQAPYAAEIAKLAEYKYLLGQVIFSGMSYIILAYFLGVLREFGNKSNSEKHTYKEMAKFIIGILVVVPLCFGISAILDRRGTLNGYVGEVFYQITTIILIVAVVSMIVHTIAESVKINKALKKKQEENK